MRPRPFLRGRARHGLPVRVAQYHVNVGTALLSISRAPGPTPTPISFVTIRANACLASPEWRQNADPVGRRPESLFAAHMLRRRQYSRVTESIRTRYSPLILGLVPALTILPQVIADEPNGFPACCDDHSSKLSPTDRRRPWVCLTIGARSKKTRKRKSTSGCWSRRPEGAMQSALASPKRCVLTMSALTGLPTTLFASAMKVPPNCYERCCLERLEPARASSAKSWPLSWSKKRPGSVSLCAGSATRTVARWRCGL